MDMEILKELGLTETEIRVYVALLELGSSTAGEILNKSKLPNSTVHRDLNSLIEKSLINFILNGKRKIYQATNPESFFDFIEDKRKRFQEILPELKEKQKQAKKKEKASVYYGIKGIKEVYNIMINAKGKEYNTFGGGKVTTEIMGETFWLNLHKKRIATKLKSRQIFDKSVQKIGKEIEKNSFTKVKYIDERFAQFQETIIVGKFVAIAVFSENPYAFLIEDEKVSESYRKHFELLWENAN